MTREPDPLDGRKLVYSLTTKGERLLPVLVALRQWGEDWGHGCPEAILVDRRDGHPLQRISVFSADGRELGVGDLAWADRAEAAENGAHGALRSIHALA